MSDAGLRRSITIDQLRALIVTPRGVSCTSHIIYPKENIEVGFVSERYQTTLQFLLP